MAVKIRLSRIGRTHAPVYRIVAIDSRTKRDGKYLENLGTYNPKTKELVQFHEDRIAYWISVGAIVVDSVKKLQKLHARKKKADAAKAAAPKATAPKKAAAKATTAKKEAAPAEKVEKKAAPKKEAAPVEKTEAKKAEEKTEKA